MDKVTAKVEALDGPVRDEDGWEHYPYRVKLSYQGRSMTTPFKTGTGWTEEPTASDVLGSLLSDASGIDNARGDFEMWAAEYGYNTDSRKAEKIFRQCKSQTEKLAKLLGEDYEAAVFPDDGDTEAEADRLGG